MSGQKKQQGAASSKQSPSPVDLSQIKTYSIRRRSNKVTLADMAIPLTSGGARKFFDSLPNQLKSADLRKFIDLTVSARRRGLPAHWMMGAHVIKVGLAPIIIDLMKRGLITGVSFNGAGVIHDLELAFTGATSEDVQAGLADGSFGMVSETAAHFAETLKLADSADIGFGAAVGAYIRKSRAVNARVSILAEAARLGLPATIHVAIGSDIVAQHESFPAALAGERSHYDFRLLADILQKADRGGVVANIGSVAILPEVFLKALTVARNLTKVSGKKPAGKIITANFDMISHYRPFMNVVNRPTAGAGHGFEFIGHHEIMLPLLAWGLKDRWRETRASAGKKK